MSIPSAVLQSQPPDATPRWRGAAVTASLALLLLALGFGEVWTRGAASLPSRGLFGAPSDSAASTSQEQHVAQFRGTGSGVSTAAPVPRVCLITPMVSRKDVTWSMETVSRSTLLNVNLRSILRTTTEDDGLDHLLMVGFPGDDAMFGDDALRAEFVRQAAEAIGKRTNVHLLLRPIWAAMCGTTAIWNILAGWGYDIGCDYFVPNNDDVLYLTTGWATMATEMLASRDGPCPNFGVVAFRDLGAPDFPTFHMVGRIHVHIHRREYYPISLHGAGVDPWLWRVYLFVDAADWVEAEIRNHVLEYDEATGKAVTAKDLPPDLQKRYDAIGPNGATVPLRMDVAIVSGKINR